MSEELDQQIRLMLQEVDATAPAQALPDSAQMWSHIQFRLHYRPHGNTGSFHGSIVFVAIYLLALLMWNIRFAWLNLGVAIVLASAVVAAASLCMLVSRSFRS
ncbi:MAG: hypothetical protein QOD84_1981 [Acidobacteriaceae bacterium]|jgi:hypothetical protein